MEPNVNEAPYISFKGLLFAVLKKTGIILIAGLVLGAALFAYKFFKKTQTFNVLDTSVKMAGESDVHYEERVQNIDRARDIVLAISRLNAQIDNQRNYIADSIYMQIDASNQCEATIQALVYVDDSEASGMENALISAFESDIRTGNYLDGYASELGTKPGYIKDLISFNGNPAETTVQTLESTDKAGKIGIWVYGPSEEYVGRVVDLVIAELNNKSAELNKSVAKHNISVVSVQRYVRNDNNTRDGQTNQTSKLETLQKQITTYNESLTTIAASLGVSDKEDLINHFAAEAAGNTAVSSGTSEVSIKSMIKSGLKFGIIGFLAGALLAAAVVVFKYVFGKNITTQDQFFSEFAFVRKIGVLKPSGKRSKFATKIDIRSEDDSKMTAENTKKLISANYENITKDFEKILITGTGDIKAMSEAVKSMGLKGDFKPDIFSDPDILRSVPDYDAVVLIEQRGVSLFKNVKNEINLITNGGAEIAGAIII